MPSQSFAILDMSPLQDLGSTIADLARAGWNVRDAVGDIRLQTNTTNPCEAIAKTSVLERALGNIELVGEIAGHQFRIRSVQGELAIVDFPGADPYGLFDDEEDVEKARQAWEGDTDAALQLPLEWTITAFLAPENLLDYAPSSVNISIALQAATIARYFREAGFSNLARCVPLKAKRRVYIALAEKQPPCI